MSKHLTEAEREKLAHEYGSECLEAAAGITAQPFSAGQVKVWLKALKSRVPQEAPLLVQLGGLCSRSASAALRTVIGLALRPRNTAQEAMEEETIQNPVVLAGSVLEAISRLHNRNTHCCPD